MFRLRHRLRRREIWSRLVGALGGGERVYAADLAEKQRWVSALERNIYLAINPRGGMYATAGFHRARQAPAALMCQGTPEGKEQREIPIPTEGEISICTWPFLRRELWCDVGKEAW